jgi:hypothetical protein
MKMRISDEDAAFLTQIGGGSQSHGFETVMKMARAVHEAYQLRAGEREKNAHKYAPAEAALIRSRGAPCLTCNCDETDRAHCEAW